jgi:hypothetical protein
MADTFVVANSDFQHLPVYPAKVDQQRGGDEVVEFVDGSAEAAGGEPLKQADFVLEGPAWQRMTVLMFSDPFFAGAYVGVF